MRTLRRIASIIGYLIAGMFLLTWGLMSFVGGDPEAPKAFMMTLLAGFSLVPLAIAAVISPGRRRFEVGVVLLVAAGWTAAVALTLGIMLTDPTAIAVMPPETIKGLAMFNDPVFGALMTTAMGAAGLWLVRRKDRAAED